VHAANLGSGEVKTLAAFVGFSANALLAGADGKIFNVTSTTTDATDGNDQYTKVLLHFEGSDAGTTITDSNLGGSAHTWTAAGNANTDDAQEKFGSTSLACDGTGDWASTPDHADFSLGSGDFTMDLWFLCNAAGGTFQRLAGQADATATAAGSAWHLRRTDGNVISWSVSNGSAFTTVTGTTQFTDADNTGWHHLALVRTGDVLKMFIDGVQEGSNTAFTGSVNDSAEVLGVGASGGLVTTPWTGWIDEFRLSVGAARWTAAFTPPTSAYGETILASGFTQDRWQTALYSDRLFFVNGTDNPQVYNGSTVAGIAWSGSGLTDNDLVNIALVRNRLWFCENNQAWVWYGAIGQITAASALTKFDLSQIAGGGFCMAAGSWSVTDSGDGADDLTVFVMSTGEIIVYQGDPATTFSLVGKYMGAPPIGRQCLVKVGGELVVITRQGFLPLSAAVRVSAGKALDFSSIDPWGKVAPGVAEDAKTDASNGGWHAILHLGVFYGNVPQTEGSISKQWVMNSRNGSWATYNDWNASSFASLGGDLYFGSQTGGKVMLVGGATDQDEPITVQSSGAFVTPRGRQYGNVYTAVRPILSTEGTVSGLVGVDTDYRIGSLTGNYNTLAETSGGTEWGSAWGSSWGSSQFLGASWFLVQGRGSVVSVRMIAESSSPTEWFSSDVLYKPGGLRGA
jgi:hypothetical protein